MVCDYRLQKTGKHYVRLTIGGDKLEYDFDTTFSAASFIDTKLLLNSIISDSSWEAQFMTMDIEEDYLFEQRWKIKNLSNFVKNTVSMKQGLDVC